MFNSTEILFFQRYLFTDTGHEAPHYGLVIVPSHLTDFKESILCAVMTSQRVRDLRGTHKLFANDYDSLAKDTIIRLRDLDYVPHHGLHDGMNQPVTALNLSDARQCFNKLKSILFNPSIPHGVDPYLRAAIIREWKKAIVRLSP